MQDACRIEIVLENQWLEKPRGGFAGESVKTADTSETGALAPDLFHGEAQPGMILVQRIVDGASFVEG